MRAFIDSVSGSMSPGMKTAVLRMEGELGISIPGMHSLRWKFSEDEVATKRSEPAAALRFRGTGSGTWMPPPAKPSGVADVRGAGVDRGALCHPGWG
jgi:hypothetical protein